MDLSEPTSIDGTPVKSEPPSPQPVEDGEGFQGLPTTKPEPKTKSRKGESSIDASKRRCVSTACIACRKRKSKVSMIVKFANQR